MNGNKNPDCEFNKFTKKNYLSLLLPKSMKMHAYSFKRQDEDLWFPKEAIIIKFQKERISSVKFNTAMK